MLVLSLVLGMQGCRKKSPEELYIDAQEAMNRRDLLGAIAKCRKLIEETPDAPVAQDARMMLSANLLQSRDFEGAREVFAEVIRHAGGTDHSINQEVADRNDNAKDHMRLKALQRRKGM